MNMHDETYFSDDEFSETIQKADNVIVFSNNKSKVKSLQQNPEMKKNNDQEIEEQILNSFNKLSDFGKFNSIEIMDKCSFIKFYNFMISYKK